MDEAARPAPVSLMKPRRVNCMVTFAPREGCRRRTGGSAYLDKEGWLSLGFLILSSASAGPSAAAFPRSERDHAIDTSRLHQTDRRGPCGLIHRSARFRYRRQRASSRGTSVQVERRHRDTQHLYLLFGGLRYSDL